MPPLRVGVTVGDPGGIGPEIIRAALVSNKLPPGVEFRPIGDVDEVKQSPPGDESARIAWHALETAAQLANAGEIDAVVTGPIHKANMAKIGFPFLGQTEFFAARAGVTNYAMLLTAGAITVALVTTHLPLREVAPSLRQEEIVRVGKLLAAFLRQRHLPSARIAVAGLNPHAGESGMLGTEEHEIISPAISALQAAEPDVFYEGPIPPDTLFYQLANGKWDAALCMYHDQGLIPLKLHGFDQGVNVTLGLPYPRTSPDHGTAFDIAGRGIARPDSMIAACCLAAELAGGGR